MGIVSCNYEKKATNYFKLHTDKLAPLCAKEFPVKDSFYVKDSVRFDTLYLESEPEVLRDSFFLKGDTIVRQVTKECPKEKIITKYITHDSIIIRRDIAKETDLQNKVAKLVTENTTLTATITDKQKTLNWWRKIAIIEFVLIVGFVAVKIFKPNLPFKIP